MQFLMCCIDRLNPPPEAAVDIAEKRTVDARKGSPILPLHQAGSSAVAARGSELVRTLLIWRAVPDQHLCDPTEIRHLTCSGSE